MTSKPHRPSYQRWIIVTMMAMLLTCPRIDAQTDTLVIQKKDTLIYLIPIKQIQYNPKTSESNPIASFMENRDDNNILNKWLKNLILSKEKKDEPEQYDADHLEKMNLFLDRTIRLVVIKRLPPFGPSVNDTISSPVTWVGRTGNRLRVPTGRNIIANNITFQAGDQFNAEAILESERILRNLEWINDARIIVSPVKGKPDLIDIEIIIQDNYPHALSVDLGSESPEVSLYTRNFMGQGVYFNQTLAPLPKSSGVGFEDNIKLNNIKGSRIDFELSYIDNNNRNLVESQLERNFYISDHQYGGGMYYNRSYKNAPSQSLNQFNWPNEMNYYFSSIWIGRKITPNMTQYLKNANLYITLQHIGSKFHNIPDTLAGHPLLQLNHYFFGALSFGKRQYFKNNLVYSFGKTEDIPYGFLATLTTGLNHNQFATRPYIGFKFSVGHAVIPDRGYLYTSAGWENYFNKSRIEQAALMANIKYITPLIKVGGSLLRTFMEVNYIKGINRYPQESLFINEKQNGVALFSDNKIKGTEKLVLNIENVTFTPIQFWGFKMALFTFADIAWINNSSNTLFNKNNNFACLGGGIKIRNERLVFRTLELRLGYITGKQYNQPLEYKLSNETVKRFDDFIPSAPKFNLFK
ncbi:MAG: hypothetical protein KBH01_00145 [Breznakibacter sp.]|nr:hypothetical protein [Breznakibacter sp.]